MELSTQIARRIAEHIEKKAGDIVSQEFRDDAASIVATELAPVMDVLKLCRSALKSLPTDALGQDSEAGHYYRDELLEHVEKVLGQPSEKDCR